MSLSIVKSPVTPAHRLIAKLLYEINESVSIRSNEIQKGDYIITVHNNPYSGQVCTVVYFDRACIVQIEELDDLDKIVKIVKIAIS